MDDLSNENYDGKWEIFNRMFIIEQLARKAHNEIYRDNIDHMKIFLLYKKLFNQLELPEKQLLQDILTNRNLMTNMVIR